MLTKIRKVFGKIDPAWRAGLGTFLLARLFYSLWSFAILIVFPLAVQNITLGGEPVLTIFDLPHNQGYVYSRMQDGQVLTFRAAGGTNLVDQQTGARWDYRSGKAVAGGEAGKSLLPAAYSASDVFPYRSAAVSQFPCMSVWQRFDTNWYLKIARSGYSMEDGSTAFFPLYPLLIRLVGFLTGDDLFAALLISNLALLGAFVLLHKLTAEVSGRPTANRTLFYLAIFPTSFFLFAAYTEALFLFLALVAFWSAQRKLWWLTALAGTLAAFTRLQGALLILPLAYLWWIQKETRRWWEGLSLLAIPTATLAFFLSTKAAMAGDLQNIWQAEFLWPWQNVWAAVLQIGRGTGSVMDGLNLFVMLFVTLLCILAWKRLPRAWNLYMLAMFIAPMFRMNATQPLTSLSRYVIVIFPAFFLLAKWGKNPWVNRLIVYAGFLAALYFCAQFLSWGWVA